MPGRLMAASVSAMRRATSVNESMQVPKSLLPKGGACLQAVSLSTGAAWFVLTTAHEEEKSTIYQTTLVSWATTLRGAAGKPRERQASLGLQWMRPTGDAGGLGADRCQRSVGFPTSDEEASDGVVAI
jgi:hypothetical protein